VDFNSSSFLLVTPYVQRQVGHQIRQGVLFPQKRGEKRAKKIDALNGDRPVDEELERFLLPKSTPWKRSNNSKTAPYSLRSTFLISSAISGGRHRLHPRAVVFVELLHIFYERPHVARKVIKIDGLRLLHHELLFNAPRTDTHNDIELAPGKYL
jgi:hypothetical protein